ncbi:LysR family transcriptional regulator [Ahrensia sp. R2A130]|uniref:LysR family transcriptional regulator n=1 Tax=Ahrensia sp. R2A130 TaxID=744979 RepID=UPI0001E0D0E6|nr:LysR family transcriptional regulator [Ahrensia sp. R2A130]EFL89263.1 LysR family transcriptional regulator [Ahrensia sp. R2A130]
MQFDWLRDLDHLAETGNFSRAAKLSHLSQSAFSRRIKALEEWVGAALVDRSRQPVHLLPAGEQILHAGRRAREHLDNERNTIREALGVTDKQVVTFAVPHSIGWRFFPDWLNGLEDGFGAFPSSLRVDDLPRCLEALENGQADFILSYESANSRGLADNEGLQSLDIGRDELLPVSKPSPDGTPVFSLDKEADENVPWLRFDTHAPMAGHLAPIVSELENSGRLKVVYENSMAGALRIRARDGAGIAWLPRSLVAPDLAAGVLVVAGSWALQVPMAIKLYRDVDGARDQAVKLWTFLQSKL